MGSIFEAEVTPAMHDAADTVLARMGVAHLAGITLDRMSTGEARRVLIARALVTSPEALLLDEPTTGLDLVARYQFLESLREVARQARRSSSSRTGSRRSSRRSKRSCCLKAAVWLRRGRKRRR